MKRGNYRKVPIENWKISGKENKKKRNKETEERNWEAWIREFKQSLKGSIVGRFGGNPHYFNNDLFCINF